MKALFGILSVSLLLTAGMWPGPVAAEEPAVKVGAVMSMTGEFSGPGRQVNDGLQDCLVIANEEGGINGKKIEYIMEDGQYQLGVARKAFETIMNRDKPLAMFGDSTDLGKAMAEPIRDRYKILYGSVSFASDLAQSGLYPSIFIPGPTYSDQVGFMLRYIASQKPGAKVVLFYSDTEFGKDPVVYARKLCRKMNLELVAEITEALVPKDVDVVVNKVRQADPDYVLVHGFAGAGLPDVVRKARSAGMKCQFAVTFWEAHKTVLDQLGTAGEGLVAVSPYSRWWMEDLPMIKKIRAFNAKHHPEVRHRPSHYMLGFASGLIFVELMRQADKAGKLNYDGMVEALRNMKDFDTGGLTAPLTCYNNSFPQARIWKADVSKGQFVPETDWTTFRLKRSID
jgi:branched-chain amino acid transport system substrate-binding protein